MPRTMLFARTLALVAAFSMLLATCGGRAPAAQPTPNSAAPAGGLPITAPATVDAKETLLFSADLSDQISFDPAVAYEFGGIQVVGSVYQTLATLTPGDPTIKPLLAESWDINGATDGWTVTFKLDKNAKFASGNPVTADDVAYSWGRVLDLNKSPAFLLSDVARLKKDSFTAVDPQTFEVRLAKSTSPQVFLAVISFSVAAVVEKAIVETHVDSDFGSIWLNDHSAGSGPYVLSSWQRGTQTVLDVNANFWGHSPAIKRVIMRNVTELANLQSAIETGDADIVQSLGAEQVKALEGDPNVQIIKAASTALVYIGMNAKSPPLNSVDVRQAIRYAINYDDVNILLGGNGKITQEIIPAGLFGHTGENPFTQDIAKAKDLLAKVNVEERTEIEFLIPTGTAPGGIEWSTLAAKIQDDVGKIGLKLAIKRVQQSELLNIYRAQKSQMVLAIWEPDFPDPDGNVTPFTNYDAKSIAWRNVWEHKQIGALGQQAAIEQDTTKRAELYKQLTERVLNEGPYAMLYQPTLSYGVRKNISGFTYDSASTPNIWFWTITKN